MQVPRGQLAFTTRVPVAPAGAGALTKPKEPVSHKHSQCRLGSAPGMQGAKPLAKITYSQPPSRREGGRGMGARKQVKGRVNRRQSGHAPRGHRSCRAGRRQSRHAPRRVSLTPAAPATPGQAPPPIEFSTVAGRTSAAWVQPRGCKGRSPLHKITYSHPLPAVKGAGGIGAEKKSKGRVSRRPKPTRPPLGTADARRTDNAGASPPIEFSTAAGRTSAARVQPRGCKGRSPLHKKTKNLPLPHRGRGAGG